MASTGVALDHDDGDAGPSHEWLEAGAADLARPTLLRYASHRDARIRETIALRPDCPIGVLATLAFDADRSVRRAVAASPRIIAAIATELLQDRDREVLHSLARNPRTDAATLEILASHRRGDIRRIAARTLLDLEGRQEGSAAQDHDLDSAVPHELRDRWRPQSAESSPSPDRRENRMLAPRPAVPRRAGVPRAVVPGSAPEPTPHPSVFLPTRS